MITKGGLLLLSDIPQYLSVCGHRYKVTENETYVGSFNILIGQNIIEKDILQEFLEQSTNFIICIYHSSIAILKTYGQIYYVFDSHS